MPLLFSILPALEDIAMGRYDDIIYSKIHTCFLILAFLVLTGCSGERLSAQPPAETQASEKDIQEAKSIPVEPQTEILEPVIKDVDWADYFQGINGAAVIFDPTENCYQIYHSELALTRRSPCSTFKIISALAALEHGVIDTGGSMRIWSGEVFWNADWNRDIDFPNAFRTSCVWYFRQVVNEIGEETMQAELSKLQYGNCDLSDWEGRLNTNNSNPALTGFWIESSLLISPKEQTEVMERIFGSHSDYSPETLDLLKTVMLLPEASDADLSIYGKTGMGKAHGVVVDAWFTGFADTASKRVFFCVYLGESGGRNVSSTQAKEISIGILSDYLR